MDLLDATLKHYEWGSKSDLAHFRGLESSGRREAELWFDQKATDPWLVKILAVETPLSLQVHPNVIEALNGFEYENTIGIPVGSSERLFRDSRAKPEFICALTPFITFGGFKEFDEILRTVSSLKMPDDLISIFKKNGISAMKKVISQIIAGRWIDDSEALLDSYFSDGLNIPENFTSAVKKLRNLYPEDPALMILPFLKLHCMQPGDGLFVGTGMPHCYLSGMAVEFMPLSENVIRGGFTQKNIDRERFVEITNFENSFTHVQVPTGDLHIYDSLIKGMEIRRIKSTSFINQAHEGKDLIVCIEGNVVLEAKKRKFFSRGEALLIDASVGDCSVEVNGEAYMATFLGR